MKSAAKISSSLLCIITLCLMTVSVGANEIKNNNNSLNEFHHDASEDLSSFIIGIDEFFGNTGDHENSSDLIIDVEVNSLESRYVKGLHTQKYRVKVRLDSLNQQIANLGKRIDLIVEPNYPLPAGKENEEIDYQQPTSSVHLQISGPKNDKVKYQLGHNGFKSLFIGATYSDAIKLPRSQIDMNTILRVTNEGQTQLKLAPSFNNMLHHDWLQVIYSEIQYLSDEEYQDLTFGGKWHYKLSSGQALSMGLSSYVSTENSFQNEKYLLNLSHRLKLYSSWIFLNSELFSDWQKTRNFSANPGIQLGLNIYFGN